MTTKKKNPAAKPKPTYDSTPGNLKPAAPGTSAATTESGYMILTCTTDTVTTVERVAPNPDSSTTSDLATEAFAADNNRVDKNPNPTTTTSPI